MSGGEEAEEAAPVPEVLTSSAEYQAVFGSKPSHDAVLEVVCRAAAIMAKLCGDNKEEGYTMTEAEAKALSEEAFDFVTNYVRALFGPIHTTKFHALAYHLLAELMLRGNVIEADTSVNEALHKLIKNMWDNTNKQTTCVLLQMLRAEQTLAHITESEALEIDLQQSVGSGTSAAGDCGAGGGSGAETGDGAGAAPSEPSAGDDAALIANAAGGTAEVDDRCTPSGPAELDVLSVFDELATMSAMTGGPGHGSAEEDPEEEYIDVNDDMDGARGGASLSPDASMHVAVEDSSGATARRAVRDELGAVADVAVGVAGSLGVASRAHHAGRRVRIAGRRTTVSQAAAADGGRLSKLLDLLKTHPSLQGCSGASELVVANTFKFDARLEWRARPAAQLLRATHELYRKPWWDHLLYDVPGACPSAKPELGLARLLVRAVDGRRRDFVVVQRLVDAPARPGCVLSSFQCMRKKWAFDSVSGWPQLALVPLSDVRRLEHVVPDFEDLAERWGMTATPTTVPDSPREREEQRFFTNPFFAWTSNNVTDAP